jgi:hypothetical protein
MQKLTIAYAATAAAAHDRVVAYAAYDDAKVAKAAASTGLFVAELNLDEATKTAAYAEVYARVGAYADAEVAYDDAQIAYEAADVAYEDAKAAYETAKIAYADAAKAEVVEINAAVEALLYPR